jgi:hypothetical protein
MVSEHAVMTRCLEPATREQGIHRFSFSGTLGLLSVVHISSPSLPGFSPVPPEPHRVCQPARPCWLVRVMLQRYSNIHELSSSGPAIVRRQCFDMQFALVPLAVSGFPDPCPLRIASPAQRLFHPSGLYPTVGIGRSKLCTWYHAA